MAGCCGEAREGLTELAGRSGHVGNWDCLKPAGRSKPRGGVPAGRPPRVSYDRVPTASPVRRLKHHDQVCSSAAKVPWYARTRESLRLLPRRGRRDGTATSCGRNRTQFGSDHLDRGGTLASPDAQEHRAIGAPGHEARTSVRIRMNRCQRWAPSSNVRRGFRNSPPAQRPSSPNAEIRYFGNLAKGSLAVLMIVSGIPEILRRNA